MLLQRMEECVDGEYQDFKAKDGAYVREHFFGKYPELKALVADMSDDEIWALNRGGHDPNKVYAAYAAAVKHKGQPTVILAKTVKGYGMGEAGEGQKITHQEKKMGEDASARVPRPLQHPDLRRAARGNAVPAASPRTAPRRSTCTSGARRSAATCRSAGASRQSLADPAALGLRAAAQEHRRARDLDHDGVRADPGHAGARQGRSASTSCRSCRTRSRTFGMEGMFRQLGIYRPGRPALPARRTPTSSCTTARTRRARCCRRASTRRARWRPGSPPRRRTARNNVPMIPFYIYYSMFGFQRVGDFAWAAGDMRARGFLLGGTAGRTTLNGEGLQHEDGHSHILASAIPNCVSYDPTFAYEVGGHHPGRHAAHVCASRRTSTTTSPLMNENYAHPAHAGGRARKASSRACICCGDRAEAKTRPARAAAGQRHDPARSHRRRGLARERVRRLRRHLELPELHRAAPRGTRGGALEPAASGPAGAQELRRAVPRRTRRSGDRRRRTT